MRILFAILLFISCGLAQAQTTVITQPYPATTKNNSGSIAVTNTFQSIWSASTNLRGRASCTIANYGTNKMYVFFGPIANATLTNSIQLPANASVNCNIGGVVLQDQVSITGTSGDAYYAAQQ